MNPRFRRVYSEARAEWSSFLRKPAAVFFTFVFPAILVGIFAFVIGTGGGFFDRPQGYYYPGYLAFVVLLTPLSRLSSTVARGRDSRRFEKLATTPMSRLEWLAAHVLVNGVLILLACVLITLLLVLAGVSLEPSLGAVSFTTAAVVLGVVGFCGVGAVIGRLVSSEDGAIAASNGVGFPMLFLADTFVAPETLGAGEPIVAFLPLTYFSRSVRGVSFGGESTTVSLIVLGGFAVAAFAVGAYAVPWRE